MAAASAAMAYERAAALRDKLRSIERTMESQKMAARSDAEADLVGLAREANDAAVQLFVMREGTLVGARRLPAHGRRRRDRRDASSAPSSSSTTPPPAPCLGAS